MRLLDRWVLAGLWIGCLVPAVMPAAEPGELTWPPKLPGGRTVVSDRGEAFLVAPPGLSADVKIAKTPPSVDFLYYPGQDYPGNPWSVWGDSVAVGGKYYSAIGDHIGPAGNAFVYEYDPATGKPPVKIAGAIGLRSATQETSDGYVYTVSTRGDGSLWRFKIKTEAIEKIGKAAVGRTDYVTSLDVGPSGRFLCYTPGAHGGSQFDGTPIVQFDTKLRTRKVIAFLHPFYLKKLGYISLGTFGSALSPDGRTLYVTWNGNRGGLKRRRYGFDTCAMTAIHIPASERGGETASAK